MKEKKNMVSDRDLENKALQLKLAPLRLKVKEVTLTIHTLALY